jgi:hypothetical protein
MVDTLNLVNMARFLSSHHVYLKLISVVLDCFKPLVRLFQPHSHTQGFQFGFSQLQIAYSSTGSRILYKMKHHKT